MEEQNTQLQLRLNPDPEVQKLEAKLRGEKIVQEYINTPEGYELVTKTIKTGRPLLNEDGINGVMMCLSGVVNTSTVQGNLSSSEEYGAFMCYLHKEINRSITTNKHEWGVRDVDHLMTVLMPHAVLFVSRVKDNGERISYNTTMRTVETQQIQEAPDTGYKLPVFKGGL